MKQIVIGNVNVAVVVTSAMTPAATKPAGNGTTGVAKVVIVVMPGEVTRPERLAPPGVPVPPAIGATTVAVPTLVGT